MALFEAHELACQRGDRVLFQGLDFALVAGEALILEGTNGSGKSSLLRLAAGLARPAAGGFAWDGKSIAEDPDQHRRRLLYLGHADAVKGSLTVRENLQFWADLGGAMPDRVPQALDYVELTSLAEMPARFLSAGQRRRLTLARLLLQPAAEIPLWLLDEPTTALDSRAQARLTDLIRQHLQAGGLVLLASHDRLEDVPGQRLRVDGFQPALLHLDGGRETAGGAII
jgi:heme exporter protein A